MGQHSKYSFEMKLDAVTKYLEGSCSTESIARSLGTNGTRIVEWVTLYQSLGIEGLKTTPKLRVYSAETKCCCRLPFRQRNIKGNPEKVWNPLR
ncbi:transposase [Lachnospiraceae bacterium 42-17]